MPLKFFDPVPKVEGNFFSRKFSITDPLSDIPLGAQDMAASFPRDIPIFLAPLKLRKTIKTAKNAKKIPSIFFRLHKKKKFFPGQKKIIKGVCRYSVTLSKNTKIE